MNSQNGPDVIQWQRHPKFLIDSAYKPHFDVLSVCLSKNFEAECTWGCTVCTEMEDTAAKEADSILLVDCMDCNENAIDERVENFFNNSSADCIRPVLFNVANAMEPIQVIYRWKIRGVFFEGDSEDVFVKGMKTILQGGMWISRKIMSTCVEMVGQLNCVEDQVIKSMTPRQREILMLLKDGASNQEIAEKLCISINTVKTHMYNLYKKLKVSNRLQALRAISKLYN